MMKIKLADPLIFKALPFVLLSCYAIARRMPYLLNMHNMWIYFCISLAIILVIAIYFIFFHIWKKLEINSAMILFSKRKKVKGLLGLLGLSVVLVWMSWGVAGCSAYLFSKAHYSELYTISKLKTGGRKGWDVTLVDAHNKKYMLTLSNLYMSRNFPWREGDIVCAIGRTSFFGAIIEGFSANECKLNGFRNHTKNQGVSQLDI
ncbi:MAG: hypothetical protein ACKE5Q_05055 [Methylophilaceae bacterium]